MHQKFYTIGENVPVSSVGVSFPFLVVFSFFFFFS